MDKLKLTETARGVIFNEDGKLLLIERRAKGEHYYSLPGGHVDEDETPEDTLVREVLEETGLAITVARLLYLFNDSFRQRNNIFLCNYHGGEPQLPPESTEAQIMETDKGELYKPTWLSPAELRDLRIYPAGLIDFLDEDIAQDFANNPREIVEKL